ncbi:somatomedin-B and thrombospondin type-1 domain-containing protein [Genypterus blacodes]|uniref:somatomedin-B and thrombospondin type-1 domain-containing protein n=1 Tax=Genypterus blacodes TaxID=154954 RepID=UPI003F76FB85
MAAPRVSSVTLLCLCVVVSLLLVSPCEASCRDVGLCCTGRDLSCMSTGWRSDRSYGTCYCDQACVLTMDCCHDYNNFCPAVPCLVSEWTKWSCCAKPCRAAARKRSRTILQEPLNAGKPCPHLEEQAGCLQYHSEQGQCQKSLVPALITAGGYGNSRKKRDIPDSIDIIGYCVQFQLTALTKGCQQSDGPHTQWMQYLREGHRVCVECQPPALAAGEEHCTGDGEESQEVSRHPLQWQAVGNPRCRGAWRRVGRLEACSCPTAHSFLFI